MSVISMKQLLEAGVHFGHQTRRWNPKMAPYIYTERNGIYIIDLQKSVGKVDEAYNAIRDCVANGGKILFVGTKKQAQDSIKNEAERCGMYYVNQRWLGGMLDVYKRQTSLLINSSITSISCRFLIPSTLPFLLITSTLDNKILLKTSQISLNTTLCELLLCNNLFIFLVLSSN